MKNQTRTGPDLATEPQPIEAGEGLPKNEDPRWVYQAQARWLAWIGLGFAVIAGYRTGWRIGSSIGVLLAMAAAYSAGVARARANLASRGFNYDLDRGIGVISAWSGVVYRYYENGLALDKATEGHATTPDPGRKEGEDDER